MYRQRFLPRSAKKELWSANNKVLDVHFDKLKLIFFMKKNISDARGAGASNFFLHMLQHSQGLLTHTPSEMGVSILNNF